MPVKVQETKNVRPEEKLAMIHNNQCTKYTELGENISSCKG